MNELLTTKQAAELLGVHTNTLYKLLASNELPSVRIGQRLIRIDRRDIEAYLQNSKITKS